jgi:hypothetical protein
MHDLNFLDIECIWIEQILKRNLKMLIGLFYRRPNSDAQYDLKIEQSFDLGLNSEKQNIPIVGDFNLSPAIPASKRKLLHLYQVWACSVYNDPNSLH